MVDGKKLLLTYFCSKGGLDIFVDVDNSISVDVHQSKLEVNLSIRI